MRQIIRSARFLFRLTAGVAFPLSLGALAACGSVGSGGGAEVDGEHVGSIGLALELTAGLTLDQITYAITGPGAYASMGTLDLTNSTVVSGTISGLPAGSGYTVTLTGTAADGSTTCSGSAAFDIVARQTARASVALSCREPAKNGSVKISGTVNICPTADGVVANPAEVLVGGTIALSTSAYDPDNGPSPLAYQWTASSGTLNDATLAAPTFTCTAAGASTVTVTVSDGDSSANCADSASITVTCTPATAQVQAILDANCTSCHSGSAPARGLSLVDVRTAIGVPAAGCAQKVRIVSGQPTQSYLVDKVLGMAQDGACFSGKQMPLNKPALSASDLSTIRAWIAAGTPL